MSDTFGLTLASSSILQRAPLIFIYGAPKTGKSFDAALAFNEAFWLCSDPKVLRAYASWYHEVDPKTGKRVNEDAIQAKKLRDPEKDWDKGGMARVVINEYQADMKTRIAAGYNIRKFIEDHFAPAASSGKWPTHGLVIDEMTAFVNRILVEEEANPQNKARSGEVDQFAVYDKVTQLVLWLSQIANATNQPVIMMWNEKVPKYNERKNHREFGQLQYKGGPDAGVGKLPRTLCHLADAILHRVIIEGAAEYDLRSKDAGVANGKVTRVEYLTSPSETWERGIRDTRVSPRPGSDLLEVLQAARMKVTR